MKHGEGKDEARELYVYQQMTFDEIAKRVSRTEKTIRAWADEGNWRQAREAEINSRTSTREKLQMLIDKIADRMIRDCGEEADLSPQSIHALTNLVTATKNLYAYESKAKVEEPEQAGVRLTPEEIAAKVAEIMGV